MPQRAFALPFLALLALVPVVYALAFRMAQRQALAHWPPAGGATGDQSAGTAPAEWTSTRYAH